MDATDARQRADLLDEVDTQLPSFAGAIARAGQSPDHFIRDVQSWNVGAHPLRRLRGPQRPYTDQDEDASQQAYVLDLAQKTSQQRDVVTVLSLNELRAGLNFFGQPL